jgi:hypothetical protein
MKKQLQSLAASSLVFASIGYGQVSQEIQVNTKILPGQAPFSSKVVTVFDTSGLSTPEDGSLESPAKFIKDPIQGVLAKYGQVEMGPETGVGCESLQVSRSNMNPAENLILNTRLESNLRTIYTAFAPVQADFQDPFMPNGIPYIELLNPSSENVSTFLHCVLFDYQENVAGKLTIPTYMKPSNNPKCSGSVSAAVLTANTNVADETVQRLKSSTAREWFATQRQYLSPYVQEVDFMECQNRTLAGSAEIVGAGWAKSSDDYTQRVDKCIAIGQDQFFALKDLLANGFQPSVLSKNITPYYRSLLLSLLEAKKDKIDTSATTLTAQVKQDIKDIAQFGNGFAKSALSSNDFDVVSFNKAAQDKAKTPAEILAILLGAPKGRVSEFRKEFATASAEDQAAYMHNLKKFLSQSCDFENFKASCLREGLSKLSGNQARVSLTFGLNNEVLWEGYVFFAAASPTTPEN